MAQATDRGKPGWWEAEWWDDESQTEATPAVPEWLYKSVPGTFQGAPRPDVKQYSNLAMDVAEVMRTTGMQEQPWMPPAPPPKPRKTVTKFTKSFISTNFGGEDPHKYNVRGHALLVYNREVNKGVNQYLKDLGKVQGDPLTGSQKTDLRAIRNQVMRTSMGIANEERKNRISALTNAQDQFQYDQQQERIQEQRKRAEASAQVAAQRAAQTERRLADTAADIAQTRQEARQKLTKGTAFTDEQGKRMLPMFNALGEYLGNQPLGKAKPTGQLTENQTYKSIYETLRDKGKERNVSEWYTKYKGHYAKTHNRSNALIKTLTEINKITLPTNITKTSQAVDWLIREQQMTEQEARRWIRTNK